MWVCVHIYLYIYVKAYTYICYQTIFWNKLYNSCTLECQLTIIFLLSKIVIDYFDYIDYNLLNYTVTSSHNADVAQGDNEFDTPVLQ